MGGQQQEIGLLYADMILHGAKWRRAGLRLFRLSGPHLGQYVRKAGGEDDDHDGRLKLRSSAASAFSLCVGRGQPRIDNQPVPVLRHQMPHVTELGSSISFHCFKDIEPADGVVSYPLSSVVNPRFWQKRFLSSFHTPRSILPRSAWHHLAASAGDDAQAANAQSRLSEIERASTSPVHND
jgi:hypothetical protein